MKISILILLMIISSCETKAEQTVFADSTGNLSTEKKGIGQRLIPSTAIVQFAGGIGMIAFGPGYSLSKRFGLDALYGYVPKKFSIEPLHIVTVKFSYKPAKLISAGKFTITPFNTGLYASYTFGDQFFFTGKTSEINYPPEYYGFSTALRGGIFLGSSIAPNKTDKFPFMPEFYFELSTNDLYLTNWITNLGEVTFFELLVLGMGIRVPLDFKDSK